MPPDPPPVDALPPPLPRVVSLADLLRERTPRLIATPAIALLQIAIFCVMVWASGEVSFSSPTLIRWGGQFAPAIGDGEWWRLLTPMVLHGHPLHIALNTVLLWQLGGYVERLLGAIVFTIVYVLCGVIASVVSLQFHASTNVSVGASGAVFGLAGILLAVAFAGSRSPGQGLGTMLGDLRGSLVSFVVYNAIAGVMLPRIDNAAHGGGLVGGLVLGWLVGRRSFEARPSPLRTLVPIALTALLAAGEVHLLAARHDLATEQARFMRVDAQAVETLQAVVQDIDVRRRPSPDAADHLERAVMPAIRDARARAVALAGTAGERQDAAAARAWTTYLEAYEDAWRLRVRGLRENNRELLIVGRDRERDAYRVLSAALARLRR
jgi:rhomboid protease GluP